MEGGGYQINKKKRIGNFYKSDALLYLIYESTVNDKQSVNYKLLTINY